MAASAGRIRVRTSARSAPALRFDAWLALPPPWRGGDFVERGVALACGEPFTVGRAPVPDAIRISLGAAPDRDRLPAALVTIADLLGERPAPPRGLI